MAALAAGMTYKEIAADMTIATSTVRHHVWRSFDALGVVGRGAPAAVVVMKDSGWLGAPPREPHDRDDSRDITPQQAAYNVLFVRLCRQRTPRAVARLAVAYELLIRGEAPGAPRVEHRPDIDDLLLRMARGLLRPIPL